MTAAPDNADRNYTLSLASSLSSVDKAAWNALAAPPDEPYNPFVSWDFLSILEETDCVGDATGWTPQHFLLRDDTGALVAAAPAYLKTHSQGEFVFDHAWADAYMCAGGQYYPKLQICSPFSPVTGPRLFAKTPALKGALLQVIQSISTQMGLSSAHVTFPVRDEWTTAGAAGFLQRTDQQFMWTNRGYDTFDDFLADLASRKRKNLKKERAAARDGLDIRRIAGPDLTRNQWDAFFDFYMDTGARKWGAPYLNRDAFAQIAARMADDVLMVLAYDGNTPIAGALNFAGGDALYGRYWGRIEERPFLHFEVCYYQAIEECIARGLARAEAGAQGGHKMARGYGPEPVYSYHYIAHEGFRGAVAQYLEQERAVVAEDIAVMRGMTPFKRG